MVRYYIYVVIGEKLNKECECLVCEWRSILRVYQVLAFCKIQAVLNIIAFVTIKVITLFFDLPCCALQVVSEWVDYGPCLSY